MKNEDLNVEATSRHKAAEVLLKNWKALAAIVAVSLLGLAGYWGMSEFNKQQNQKVRSELYRFEKAIQDKEKELYEAEVKKAEAKSKDKTKNQMNLPEVTKDAATFAANYETLAVALEAAIERNKGTDAAAASAIYLADLYSEFDQAEKARALLRKAVDGKTKSNVLRGLLRSQLAGLLMTKETCQEAIELLNGVLADKTLAFLEAPALARRAACFVEMGDMASAEADINKVKADHSDTEAARQVDTFRLIGLARGSGSSAGADSK